MKMSFPRRRESIFFDFKIVDPRLRGDDLNSMHVDFEQILIEQST
jgi:hypothetical protein